MYEDTDRLDKCRWFPFSDDPLVAGWVVSPCFSNPQILFPEESCDSRWHMFCHSWKGVTHYVSTSGIAWEPGNIIQRGAHSPSIFREKENYYLIYETHDNNLIGIPGKHRTNSSRIEMRLSTDLVTWSKSRVIFDSASFPSAGDYLPSPRIINPQIVDTGSGYKLFFGSSQVQIPGARRYAARYLSCASSSELQGEYRVEDGWGLVMQPEPDNPYSNLGCGSVRIVKTPQWYYAFQCPLYWDPDSKKYHSCLTLSKSADFRSWTSVYEKPILVPAQKGWASGFFTGCDVKYRKQEKSWYCYYFAYNPSGVLDGNDGLGLLLGSMP